MTKFISNGMDDIETGEGKSPEDQGDAAGPFVYESWDEYRHIIDNIRLSKTRWVYNLIERIPRFEQIGDEQHEANREIILRWTEHFFLITGENWKDLGLKDETSRQRNLDKFKLLAFTRIPDLRTIRDLTGDHIRHLQMMKDETEGIIDRNFPEVKAHGYRFFFHYNPSTYLLHINVELHDSPRKGHEFSFDHVIGNLESNSDYYQLPLQIYKFKKPDR
jgi:hypothetical protein